MPFNIKVPDMGRPITGLVRTPTTDYQGFRLKSAKIKQAEAVADKYHQSAIDDERSRELQQKRSDALRAAAESSENPAEQLKAYKNISMGMGDFEGFQAATKMEQDYAKEVANAKKAQLEAQALKQKQSDGLLYPIAVQGTLKQVHLSKKMLEIAGDEERAAFLGKYLDENEARLSLLPEEQQAQEIRNGALSLMSPDMKKSAIKDLGDVYQETNPLAPDVTLTKGQTPDSKATDTRAALNRRDRNIRAENTLEQKERHFNEKEKREWALKIRSKSTTNQKEAIKQAANKISSENSVRLIDKMITEVNENPRITATPLAPLARFGAALKGIVFPESTKESPAISFTQTRDLLLATADQLVRDSRMSNQDRQRLENALGGNEWMTTPIDTIRALEEAKKIIQSSQSTNEAPVEDDDWDSLTFEQKKRRMIEGR